MRDRKYLLAVVGIAFVFLAIAAYPRQWSLGLLINDEFWYAQLARSLHEGRGYVSNVMYPLQARAVEGFPVPAPMKQPGFQLVTALVWTITGESVRAMLSVALLGLVAFAGSIYLLARHLGWGNGVSMFVAGATIAHPVMAQFGVQALPEALYFATFTLTVLFLLRGSTGNLVAAGVLNAALMLIKGHGLIYIPAFAAYLWLRGSTTPKEAMRPTLAKLRAAGAYVVTIFATLLIASLVLPAGSVQIFEAGGTYSYGMLIEVGRVTSELPYLSIDPPAVWTYIFEHPDQYLGKVARMVQRTKLMMDALSGPALGGLLFPSLLLSCLLLVADTLLPGRLLRPQGERGESEPYLLFAACIGGAFLFFWPIFLTARLIIHMLPLMLLICLYVGSRVFQVMGEVRPGLRKTAVVFAVAYFVAYPGAATLWESYRQPLRLLGSLLAVRYVDYGQMADNIDDLLPDDPVVVSDMAHEIVWLTRSRAIAFPNHEEDLAYLIRKFDVDALYEHPRFRRDWPLIRREFVLADDGNGALWMRRRNNN